MCKTILLVCVLAISSPAYGQETNLWEVSIGTTQLFSSWYSKESSPVPTASATLMISRGVFQDFAIWGVFNLPLAPNKVVTKDGVSELTMTPPTMMVGGSYELISYSFSESKRVGMDIGASLGKALASDWGFFPVGAGRVKLVKGEDTTLYVGVTTAPYNSKGDLIWGLIYGAGTRF